MNRFLREQVNARGNHMRPQAYNSGAIIRRNFSVTERRRAAASFYKQNRYKYADAFSDFFRQFPSLL
jgi:hypothetical protein